MRAKLVSIGNSRGVRLPKPLIEQANLQEDVDIQVRDGTIVISSSKQPREGWAAAAKGQHSRNDDRLIDRYVSTGFDQKEWNW
jgi:antitoxin MazE